MRSKIGAGAIALALFLWLLMAPLYADELASQANVNLVLQVTDMATTRPLIEAGGSERNPLARPFVHSNGTALLYALLSNAVERIIWRHGPKGILISDGIEVYSIGSNLSSAAWNTKNAR